MLFVSIVSRVLKHNFVYLLHLFSHSFYKIYKKQQLSEG